MKIIVSIFFVSLLVCACSGGGSSTSSVISPPAITDPNISPTGDVLQGSVRTVYSKIDGVTNPAVTWSATCGSLSTANGYAVWTAPSSGTCTVKATSIEDPSKSTTKTFTVTSATVRLSNIPMQSTRYKNQPLVIQSILWGSTNTGVTWTSSGGTLTGTSGREVIFTSGVAGEYTVTATSNADPTKSATTKIVVTNNTYPALSTTNFTEPIDCTHTGTGTEYNVYSETDINSVPWSTLSSGDTVRIHPGIYHKQILISTSGTESQPIRVCGVRDGSGNLPEINGAGATAVPGSNYNVSYNLQKFAGILIYKYGVSYYGGAVYPKNIIIEGLKVTGFNEQNTFTDIYTSSSTSYLKGAAPVRVQHGGNITIRGCELSLNGNGLFAMANNSVESQVTRNLLVEGNYIHDNGAATSYLEHQSYLQALGLVVQGNYYDYNYTGSLGGQLKTRAVQQFIRYNFFKSADRIIDLVEEQDSPGLVFPWYGLASGELVNTSVNDVVANYEAYQNQYVYGNIIHNTKTGWILHGAADTGDQWANAGGTLYFYYNTLWHAVPSGTGYRAGIVDFGPYQYTVSTHTIWPTARLSNNAIYLDSGIGYFFFNRYKPDRVILDKNWITSTWGTGNTLGGDGTGISSTTVNSANVWQYGLLETQVSGIANLVNGSVTPFSTTTFTPQLASPLTGAATTLSALATVLPPLMEYDVTKRIMVRRTSITDIGAVMSK